MFYQTVLQTHVIVGLLGDADRLLQGQVRLLTEGDQKTALCRGQIQPMGIRLACVGTH